MITPLNPPALYDGAPFGMSQATIDHQSGLIHVSGQVDWDANYQLRSNTLEAQTEGALQNLATVLAAANSSFAQVLQLRIHVRGELAEHMDTLVPILARHFGAIRPALTGIGVASLASPGTLIEIEAVARVAG